MFTDSVLETKSLRAAGFTDRCRTDGAPPDVGLSVLETGGIVAALFLNEGRRIHVPADPQFTNSDRFG